MPEEPGIARDREGAIELRALRDRLREASLRHHRANESLSRAYAETDRLAGYAGAPWSDEWCHVVNLRDRAVLRRALELCQQTGAHWRAIVSEVLGELDLDDPTRCFSSDEVVALLAFLLGEGICPSAPEDVRRWPST
jgi:hypothetical protein